MTAPDIDVRPWRRPTPAKAGVAGRFALARLLLRVLGQLRQLDRKLLLLFATSLLPACIIPVGPEFQDPPGVAISPPQILTPSPDWGGETTGTSAAGALFSFSVTDLNSDDLYIRWIVGIHKVESDRHQVSGDDANRMVDKIVTCQDMNLEDKAVSRHVVKGVVADRDYINTGDDLLAVEPPGLYNLVTWTLNMTCPVSPMSPQ